jgi:hypothetical protein
LRHFVRKEKKKQPRFINDDIFSRFLFILWIYPILFLHARDIHSLKKYTLHYLHNILYIEKNILIVSERENLLFTN